LIEGFIENKIKFYLSSDKFELIPICEGGSQRQFFRAKSYNKSLIVSVTKDKEEFDYYTCFAGFFREQNIPVPLFYESFKDYGTVIMEDLGQLSLYDYISQTGNNDIISIYKKVLERLVFFQSLDVSKCAKISDRPFDYETLRWETNYFTEHIAITFLKKPELLKEELQNEFDFLAKETLKQPITVMHRDFQSQNIYIRDGNVYFIDFQGARVGALFYDAASLLQDPYAGLCEEIKNELFNYYYYLICKKGLYSQSLSQAKSDFSNASLQRIMQALGAYGNLGINKGKTKFLSYIPQALRTLDNLLLERDNFNILKQFVSEIIS